MFIPSRLYFGTAGIPNSTPRKTTVDGIKRIVELGLDSMEIEFVRGIKMSLETAREVRNIAEKHGVVLTVHAPYYINLNSSDSSKVQASIQRIIESARVGFAAGAWSVVFHSGYYGGITKETAYRNIKEALKNVVTTLRGMGIEIWVRPEVMGGISEFGSLEEVLRLSEELNDYVLPCIDFAHLHARSRGRFNTYSEFVQVLEIIEKSLGRTALDNMHIHVSGIEYGEKGEIKHLNLNESDLNYRDLIKAIKEFNVKGVIISESPNLEEDALIMKMLYSGLT